MIFLVAHLVDQSPSQEPAQPLSGLLPALALRERFAALLMRLDQIPDNFENEVTKLGTKLGDLQSAVDEDQLEEKGLPRSLALPWGQATGDAAAYKTFLEEKGNELSTLKALVGESVEEILKRAAANPEEAVKTALRSIDAIAERETLPTLEKAREEIRSILSQLGAKLQDQPPPKPLSYKQVQVQMERLSRNVWLAWALLTALGGLATLILTNPGVRHVARPPRRFPVGGGHPGRSQSAHSRHSNDGARRLDPRILEATYVFGLY